ncbi:MAG: 50S ribosomal protein L18 [Candidatus Omnitrophota bacterium]
MKNLGRLYRHRRIAKKIRGSAERPRLVIFRSNKHIYAQLVNDQQGKVLIGFSTLSKEFKEKNIKSATKDGAKELGVIFGKKAKSMGFDRVSFDRAGYKYHGRIKDFAYGARQEGLVF